VVATVESRERERLHERERKKAIDILGLSALHGRSLTVGNGERRWSE
jgi:hypothetical protein